MSGSEPPRGQSRPPKLMVFMLAVIIILLAYIVYVLKTGSISKTEPNEQPAGNVLYLRSDSTAGNPPKNYYFYLDSPPRKFYLRYDSTAGNPPK